MILRKAICLINRTDIKLSVTFDGQQLSLEPGENWVDPAVVRFAKEQNPIPGTEDPSTLRAQYLVGVRDSKDDVSPISSEMIAMLPKERLDRSLLPKDRQAAREQPSSHFPRGRVGIEDPRNLVDLTATLGPGD